MHTTNHLIEALTNSEVYRDYSRAFSETTGLPVALRPVESWQLPHRAKPKENRFCALMAQTSRTCAACLRVQQKLSEGAVTEPKTVTCEFGLCDIAIPVRLGEELIGYLQTGQVFRKKPAPGQAETAARLAQDWGVKTTTAEIKEAYLATSVLSAKQHESVVRLLAIFAQHLSMITNQIVVQEKNQEPPVITRAKRYIKENLAEKLSLGAVARAVNISTFYFCKMFKKAAGINFTEYLSRVRVERAQNLLLNPNLRVSEIAYDVGFQSLTHFNRVFKKIIGRSPTEYRAQLPKAA